MKTKDIDYPKTVCTDSSCTTTTTIDENIGQVQYRTVCHDRCQLEEVKAKTIGDPNLTRC